METKSYSSSVIGTTNDYFIIKDWNLTEGRVFDDIELNSGKTSCIIGTTIVKQLYAENETVVGTTIRLKNFSCNVIGVLESKGASAFGRDQDEIVVVPLKMHQRKIKGNNDVSSILISITQEKFIDDAKTDITTLMQERRNLKIGVPDNFYIRDMKEIFLQ